MYNNSYSNRDRSSEDNNLLSEINIIPLVDIMLVLLIVFMVAAPLSLTKISVNLPKSSQSKTMLEEPQLILSIDKFGNYFLLKNPLPEKDFAEQLKMILETRKSKVLFINADKAVSYGKVIGAMSSAKEAGVKKISMITKPFERTKQ